MRINENIVWASGLESISGVSIFCENNKNKIMNFLFETLSNEWQKALEYTENNYGNCNDFEECRYMPITILEKDYGLLVIFDNLAITYANDYCCNEYSINAVTNSFKLLEKEYPNIKYSGYIAYPWSDLKGGEVIQFEICNTGDEPDMRYLGEILPDFFINEYFLTELVDFLFDMEEDELFEIIEFFVKNKKYLPDGIVDKLILKVDEEDNDMADKLRKIFNEIIL